VRSWRQEVGRRHDVAGRSQEAADGDLARQPRLEIVVQDRRPRHHARDDRRRLEMHERVAARRDPLGVVAVDAVLAGDRLRGGERRGSQPTRSASSMIIPAGPRR
jgi:hypothetical protein